MNKKITEIQAQFDNKLDTNLQNNSKSLSEFQSNIDNLAFQIKYLQTENESFKKDITIIKNKPEPIIPQYIPEKIEAESIKSSRKYTNEKSIYDIEIEQKMQRIEAELVKNIEEIRSKSELKYYDLENKIDEIRFAEIEIKANMEKLSVPEKKPDTGNFFGNKPLAVSEDVANELYKRYQLLSKELEEYKQIVVKACVEQEEGLIENYASFEERLKKVEREYNNFERISDHKVDNELLKECLQSIKKTIFEKLKFRIPLPGIDGPDIVNEQEKNTNFAKDFMKNLNSPRNSVNLQALSSAQAVKIEEHEKRLEELRREMMFFCRKEYFEKLEHEIKFIQTILYSKPDTKDIENLQETMTNEIKQFDTKIKEFISLMSAQQNTGTKNNESDSKIITLLDHLEEIDKKVFFCYL